MDFFPLVKAIYDKIPNITADEIKDMQRAFAKEKKMKDLPSKSQILQSYFKSISEWKLEKNQTFETLLRKRAIRSLSWIVPVQVLTKLWPCPGQCIFCPNDPWMPKSYIKSEPGAMRAWLNQFDPMKQVYNRLQSLTSTGHQTDKIEMIILGWSWDAYPRDYKIDFVKQLYDACNTFSDLKIKQWKETCPPLRKEGDHEVVEDFYSWNEKIPSPQGGVSPLNKGEQNNIQDSQLAGQASSLTQNDNQPSKYHFEIQNLDEIKYSSSLEEAIKRNETAKNRIIWLTIETRPDLVNHTNCKFWRELWVTRVEMWIQSTDDEVLKLNKRWHNVQKIKEAIHIMRQYGFKISIHLMPWLYGSDFEKDIQSFKDIYWDLAFQPDEIKFYPTSVIPNTELYNLYKEWKYTPITTEQILSEICETFLNIIPPYTRIKRLIRDIPATEIEAWSNITNLSQMAHESLLKEMKDSFYWKGSIDVESFYARLYWEYELFESEEEYFEKTCYTGCLPLLRGNVACDKGVKIPQPSAAPFKKGAQSGTAMDSSLRSEWQTETQIIWTQPDLKSLRNFVCLDTRSREVRNRIEKKKSDFLNLVLRRYRSSAGQECFISFEDELGYLYWFTRLLLPDEISMAWIEGLESGTAIIRELHVYGQLQKIWEKSDSWTQHTWLWKRLLSFAGKLAKSFGYNQFSVISWVWVREYYKSLWFELKWTYMSKKL